MRAFFICGEKFLSGFLFIGHEGWLLRVWSSIINIVQFMAYTLFQFVQKEFTVKFGKGPSSGHGERNTRLISHTWTVYHFAEIHCFTKCKEYDKSNNSGSVGVLRRRFGPRIYIFLEPLLKKSILIIQFFRPSFYTKRISINELINLSYSDQLYKWIRS